MPAQIGGDRELEEAPGDGSAFGSSHSDAFSSFNGEHGSHLQINSAKVGGGPRGHPRTFLFMSKAA